MNRRMLSIFLAAGLVASVFVTGGSARAQDPPEVPAEPNIVDPDGDGNYHSFVTGQPGPVTLVAADIWAGWFSNDAESISAHVQTRGTAQPDSIRYSVFVDPGVGDDCMEFRGVSAGESTDGFGELRLTGDCGDDTIEAEFIQSPGPTVEDNDTGIHTIKVPLSASEAFAAGSVLAAPTASSHHYFEGLGSSTPVDDTDVGTDYTITGEKPKAKKKPPGKNDPPGKGKKKGCKKGKGKKKGACPGKKNKEKVPEQCAAYQPGEEGAEAETTVVTDEATEEAPVEVEIDAPMGLPEQDAEFGDAHVFHNIQVDSANSESGLFVRYEFQERRDYDLFLNYASGSEAARAAGFNTAPEGPLDGTGNGGHSETNAEQVDGLRSPDCQGYTARLSTYAGEGGAVMLKLWLGEIQNDPAPDQRALIATVFGLF